MTIIALSVGISYLDYLIPPEVPVEALYVLPMWLGLLTFGLVGGIIISIGSTILYYTSNYALTRNSQPSLWAAIIFTFFFLILLCFGAYAFLLNQRRLAKARSDLQARVEQLDQLYQESQELHNQNLKLAITEERNRLAREIHDVLAQGLTAIILQVKAAKLNRDNPEVLEQRLNQVDELAHHNLQEARRSVANLRPLPLDGSNLAEALSRKVAEFKKEQGIETIFQTSGLPQRLTGEAEGAFYRIAQEALTNVARHSTATQVQVALDYDEDEVCLTIQDNGRGFEMNPEKETVNSHKTFGLSTMQERARLIGGWVIIQTSPGEGCRIRAIVSYARVYELLRSEV